MRPPDRRPRPEAQAPPPPPPARARPGPTRRPVVRAPATAPTLVQLTGAVEAADAVAVEAGAGAGAEAETGARLRRTRRPVPSRVRLRTRRPRRNSKPLCSRLAICQAASPRSRSVVGSA